MEVGTVQETKLEELIKKHSLNCNKDAVEGAFLEIKLRDFQKPLFLNLLGEWINLNNYIQESLDNIIGLSLKLNGKVTDVTPDQSAYFFINQIIAQVGSKTETWHCVGSSDDRDFKIIKLVCVNDNGLSFSQNRQRDKCGFGLIVNPK